LEWQGPDPNSSDSGNKQLKQFLKLKYPKCCAATDGIKEIRSYMSNACNYDPSKKQPYYISFSKYDLYDHYKKQQWRAGGARFETFRELVIGWNNTKFVTEGCGKAVVMPL